MGLGKTYSADYLIDSNGNSGISGQVLISTATGIDWSDGSSIIGGPFLPLTAGSGSPLTGDLFIEKNTPILHIGEVNVSTGNARINLFSKPVGSGGNAFAMQYNKTAAIDRLEFIDGSGNANIKFNNGGSAEFAGNVTLDNILLTPAVIPAVNTPSINLRNTNNEVYFQAGSANVFNFVKADYGAILTLDGSTSAVFAGNITFGDSHFIGDDGDDNLLIQSSANENVIINLSLIHI